MIKRVMSNVKIKVGDGQNPYSQLPFLSRELTYKERKYIIDTVVQNVKDYFAEHNQTIVLSAETGVANTLSDEYSSILLKERTSTPDEGDDVINIYNHKIRSNYQMYKLDDFNWENNQ